MNDNPQKLSYEPVPPENSTADSAWLVRAFAALVIVAGLITWFSAYAGVDDRSQIMIGVVITEFGITWWILGVILRVMASWR